MDDDGELNVTVPAWTAGLLRDIMAAKEMDAREAVISSIILTWHFMQGIDMRDHDACWCGQDLTG